MLHILQQTIELPSPARGPGVLEGTGYFGYMDSRRYVEIDGISALKVLFLVSKYGAICLFDW
jgi:hypothetical protein